MLLTIFNIVSMVFFSIIIWFVLCIIADVFIVRRSSKKSEPTRWYNKYILNPSFILFVCALIIFLFYLFVAGFFNILLLIQ